MRLVLDTNVVLSAMLWRGTPYHLLDAVRRSAQLVQMYSSLPLLEELADVLGRTFCLQRMALIGITAQSLLTDYTSVVNLVEPAFITPTSRDSDDDIVLATALAAGAHIIVSGDRDLLDISEHKGIRIVTAADAMRIITGM